MGLPRRELPEQCSQHQSQVKEVLAADLTSLALPLAWLLWFSEGSRHPLSYPTGSSAG